MNDIILKIGIALIGFFVGIPVGISLKNFYSKDKLTYRQLIILYTTTAFIVLLLLEALIVSFSVNVYLYGIFGPPIGVAVGFDYTNFLPWKK